MEWRQRLVVPAWCTLLAVAIGLPWFRGGYLLAYDMVWVPHLDLNRADLWGMGSALPRAVPSDAVIGVFGAVVDPVFVQRLVLLAMLIGAGIGAARLVDQLGTLPRLCAAAFAIWNPFVAERLAMGHWPLLVAYAALFWLIDGVQRRHWGTVGLALIATSLTPVSGVMGVVALVVMSRRVIAPVLAGLVANAPWTVATLANRGSFAADSAGVDAFAIQPEGPLGRIGAALSLGGIWNTEVVPTSRTLVIATVLTAMMWAVMAVGARSWWRSAPPNEVAGLVVLAVSGLFVATLGWSGAGLLQWLIDAFGPAALLRDGTRWLALCAPLLVVLLAHGVRRSLDAAHGTTWQAFPIFFLVLPIAAMPDLANGVDGRLTPVDYPADWAAAREAIDEAPNGGDLLVLPFSIYRQPEWNENRKVLDPAGKWFSRDTVTDDRLQVGSTMVAGEDPRADRVRAILADGSDPDALSAVGIGLVLVDVTAPGGQEALESVATLTPMLADGDLRVFATSAQPKVTMHSTTARTLTIAAWIVWAVAIGVSAVLAASHSALRNAVDEPEA